MSSSHESATPNPVPLHKDGARVARILKDIAPLVEAKRAQLRQEGYRSEGSFYLKGGLVAPENSSKPEDDEGTDDSSDNGRQIPDNQSNDDLPEPDRYSETELRLP